jgi:polyhydroxyalkanoate synthase subunit PhaC
MARRPTAVERIADRVLARTMDRTVLSLVNGAGLLSRRDERPVGRTEGRVITRHGKLTVTHFAAEPPDAWSLGSHVIHIGRAVEPAPVILVPPLMVRPYVYDLRPDHSFVRALQKRGLNVYLVDFGVPAQADQTVRLEDYVNDYLPHCVQAACDHANTPSAYLIGYCMGGIFALLYQAVHRDPRISGIVTIGSPVDFARMGPLSVVSRIATDQVQTLLRQIGNVPGALPGTLLKLTTPVKSVTRHAKLMSRLWDDEFVKTFESVNHWVNDFIPYPRDAFHQFVADFVRDDKFRRGEVRLADGVVDLRQVRVPLLAFGGQHDTVAPIASTRTITRWVGSADRTFVEVPGGHIGVVAGRTAPDAVWRPTARWLREHMAAR